MENTNVTLLNIRASYVHIMKPYSIDPGKQPAKFSMTVLLPKSDVAVRQLLMQLLKRQNETVLPVNGMG